VLYALLTGRPPHVASSQKALEELARQGQVDPPRRHNPRTPRALDRICQKALAAELEERFGSAEDFRRELLGSLQRPRWLLAALVGMVLVLLVAGIAAWCIRRSVPPVSSAPSGGEVRPRTPPRPEKPPAGWQVYESRTGGYTVWLPGKPAEKVIDVGVGGMKQDQYQAEFKDSLSDLTFLVSHTDFKQGAFPDAGKALDAARRGAKKAMGANLLDEKQIALGHHPGYELRLTLPAARGLLFRMRLYMVGHRSFQVLVSGHEPAVDGPSAEEFFQSFRLIRDH
jgi:hypothetical protein